MLASCYYVRSLGPWITSREHPLLQDIRKAYYDAGTTMAIPTPEEPTDSATSERRTQVLDDMEDDLHAVVRQGIALSFKCVLVYKCHMCRE